MKTTLTYLDPTKVLAVRMTPEPVNYSRTGYGNRLPTIWQIQLSDKRWRRVYVIQWSNAGTAYIRTKIGNVYLGTFDPRDHV